MIVEFRADWRAFPCKLWDGHKVRDGYGQRRVNGRRYLMHRLEWMQHYDDIPNGACVMHACDVPACHAIEHLGLGTHKDNMDDMATKGRTSPGESNSQAKLTESQVVDILTLWSLPKPHRPTQREIASRYGISQSVVARIVRRVAWKHVEIGCQF